MSEVARAIGRLAAAARRGLVRLTARDAPAAWLLSALAHTRAAVLTDTRVAYRVGGPPLEEYVSTLATLVPGVGLRDLLEVALAAYCSSLWSSGRVTGYQCQAPDGTTAYLAVARGSGVTLVVRLPAMEAQAFQAAARSLDQWLTKWEEKLGTKPSLPQPGQAQAAAPSPTPRATPAARVVVD